MGPCRKILTLGLTLGLCSAFTPWRSRLRTLSPSTNHWPVSTGGVESRTGTRRRQRVIASVKRSKGFSDAIRPGILAQDTDERDACGVGFVAHPGRPSHEVIEKALNALGCMEHRGACAADRVSGDGAGLLTDVPWDLASKALPALAEAKAKGCLVGAGMIFLSKDEAIAAK